TRSGEVVCTGTAGYVSQNPDAQIVCDTVWHEMAFGLENAGVPADEMRVRVAETAYFFGMEPWFNAKVNELSGGQKQLLNLAAALALRPAVLLLDEPTAQLDPLAARDFAHALFRVNRELGVTVVAATHEPRLLSPYAGRILHLENGKGAAGSACGPGDAAIDMPASRPDVGPAICQLRDVFATYDRDARPVLRGVTLQVSRSSIHALIGGNGCGKTTLLKVMAGVMEPYRGRLARESRCAQAYLPQDPHALFMADSAAEELALWKASALHPYTDEDIAGALARFGLQGCGDRHPFDLSGGQQQLLAFAKLALTRPDFYLLDEPTKGLDARARALLASVLREEAARGAAVVLATHDMGFVAAVCDAVSFMFDGQIAATEPPAAFFAKNLFFRPFMDGIDAPDAPDVTREAR
ncbi:MAG: ATP-binding cassette domain-containing protein, partial [Eggerthellaceae bacterium]|nr:ATP-binding cassette domain-containing protein [Eggerthellaceae bacterium]